VSGSLTKLKLIFNFNRRADWQPKYSSRICSWHFPDSDRNVGPTRFKWNEDKLFDLVFPVVQKSEHDDAEDSTNEMDTGLPLIQPAKTAQFRFVTILKRNDFF